MEMDDMKHILNILALAETAKRIGILMGPESGDADILAAHALKERLGDNAVILNAPENLQNRWSHMFKKERVEKEMALALDTDKYPIDQLRYEKDGGKLRIFLSSSEGAETSLTTDAFSIEYRYPASDMIIALGFAEQETVLRALETDAPLTNEKALVRLASARAVLQEQNQGASVRTAAWNIDAMKLWSRALLRSYAENGSDVFWVFLPKEDFQKTGQNDEILPGLVRDMQTVMKLPPLIVLLWQDQKNKENNVHILFTGANTAALETLSQKTETPIAEGSITVRGFANFSEAEVEARKLLKA
jgi:hypothetical protein